MATARLIGRIGASWLLAVAVCFVLLRLMPGDPVDLFLSRMNLHKGPELVAAYRAQWGLDASLLRQFVRWLVGFFSLDWGLSFETGRPISEEFAARVPWSLAIGLGGMTTAVVAGAAIGFFAALSPRGAVDRLSRGLAIFGQSLPAFAVGLMILWIFGVKLRWISVFGGGLLERLVLPAALVALFSVGSISRLVRTGFAQVLRSGYFTTAIAKGRSRRAALWHHGRTHALLVLIAGLSPELAWIIGGTAIAEIVFAVPGLSERLIQAVTSRDYAIIQPYVALVALWVILVMQSGQTLSRALDPRGA